MNIHTLGRRDRSSNRAFARSVTTRSDQFVQQTIENRRPSCSQLASRVVVARAVAELVALRLDTALLQAGCFQGRGGLTNVFKPVLGHRHSKGNHVVNANLYANKEMSSEEKVKLMDEKRPIIEEYSEQR